MESLTESERDGVTPGAEGLEVITFNPGMSCPACPEREIFRSFHAFDRHWTMRHVRMLTTYFCPGYGCRATYNRFPDLTRHYDKTHAGRRGHPNKTLQVCRRARTKVVESQCFIDPGTKVFRKGRKQTNLDKVPLAMQNYAKSSSALKSKVVTLALTSSSITKAQETPGDSLPFVEERAEDPVGKTQWELAYDRQQAELQFWKERAELLQQQLSRNTPTWPTSADIPPGRPALDQFIKDGREAMAVLHLAEDRRFMEQLNLRRQADAVILNMKGKSLE